MKKMKRLIVCVAYINFFLLNILIASEKISPNTTTTSIPPSTPQSSTINVPHQLPAIFTTIPSNGESYLLAVMKVTQHFHHNEPLAAFSVASMIPVNPADDFASVCMQKTTHGIFRVHSKNPEAIGVVKGETEQTAFDALFKLEIKDTFNFNVPYGNNATSGVTTYFGQLFLKHGDGSVVGDTVCFARYK